MPSITVRDVPEHTRDELAARAARSGRSLQEYLRLQLIELGERPDAAEIMQRVRDRKRVAGTRLAPDAIVDHLDADRS